MYKDSLIHLEWNLERSAPHFEGNDIKFPEGLARHIIKKHTKKGDKVFDPFAGLGTTLFTAEEMSRIPFGFEIEEQKFEWVAGQLENWTHLIHDDAYNLARYNLPKMDLVLTSPPYMPRHHKWNPLFGGDPKHSGYDKYLKRMGQIFSKVKTVMKKTAPLIIQADNLHHGKNFTPLPCDISGAISKDFTQTDEVSVIWDNPKPDYPFTRYMVFKQK